jgi:hypothetical protein
MGWRLSGDSCLSMLYVGNDKLSVYAHLRRLLSHGRSPFRSCPHLVLTPLGITFGILPFQRDSFSYRGLAPHKLVGMPGIPRRCTGAGERAGFKWNVTCARPVTLVVRRPTSAAIDALAKSMLDETDLHREVPPQRERRVLR